MFYCGAPIKAIELFVTAASFGASVFRAARDDDEGIVSPVPSSVQVGSFVFESTVKVRCVAVPAAVGVKVIVIVHDAPTAKVAPQVFACEKGVAALRLMELIVSTALPVFCKVSVVVQTVARPGRAFWPEQGVRADELSVAMAPPP